MMRTEKLLSGGHTVRFFQELAMRFLSAAGVLIFLLGTILGCGNEAPASSESGRAADVRSGTAAPLQKDFSARYPNRLRRPPASEGAAPVPAGLVP